MTTVLASVTKTQHLFTVEENPRLAGWGAEVVSIAAEEAIYSLDGPVVRITTPHVPLAANPVLEDAQMPSVDRIASTVRTTLEASR
jgi:pyruvate dehydrogenase E1 component beta subunit